MFKKLESNRGQTMLEFAFIVCIVCILLLGVMEFGIIMYDKSVLTDACEAGARAGAMFRADATEFEYAPMTEAEIKTVIANYVQNRLLTFGVPFDASTDVDVAWDPSPASGNMLEVRVNFPYTFLALPNFGGMGSGTLSLAARSVMRME